MLIITPSLCYPRVMPSELPLTKLSVLVTCYNKREYVAPCFKYLNELSRLGAEIVIVDDGSNDGSSQLIDAELLKMESRPTLKTTENRGLAAARDLAIELATLEFIYCLDIDDTPNIDSVVEIVRQLSLSDASACAGNFWYLEQKEPGTPVVDVDVYTSVNSRDIRENIFDARGWWRYIYRREFLMLPGNRFGNVFKSLHKQSFVLDDIYWMAHLASQDFELLIAPTKCYLTNYLLPSHNADMRWKGFLRQVTLLPDASTAFAESTKRHDCKHNDQWMYKTLFRNLFDHMTLLPLKEQILLTPKILRASWAMTEYLGFIYKIKIPIQLFLMPMRRLKRKTFELKSH